MQVLQTRLVVASAVDNLKLYIEAEPARFPIIGSAIARMNKGLSRPGFLGMGGYTWGEERINVERFDVPVDFEGDHFHLTLLSGGKYRLSGSDLNDDFVGTIGRTETIATDGGPITLNVSGVSANVGARFKLTRDSRLETIDTLQRNLSISQLGKESDVLQVKLRGTDAAQITNTLNDIASHYVDQNAERKAEEAARSLEFLQSQVPDLKQKLDAAENVYAKVRAKLSSVDIDGEAKAVLQQSADNETQLTLLMQKRADEATRFGAGNPSIVALDDQIAVLRTQSGVFNERINRLPETDRQVVIAERDVKVDNDLYVGLLNNIEELQLLRAGRIGNVRVLDSAVLPDRPMRLWRPVLSAVVVVLAAIVAIAAAHIRHLLFGGISDSQEIEESTDLRVFAIVPKSSRRGYGWSKGLRENTAKPRILALVDPGDPAIEGMRSLRTSLQFSMADAANNVVMLTGPSPSIGKSFVSSNVAAVLARTGKRVLLIDGDLRRSGLSRAYGRYEHIGLADVIAERATLDEAIQTIKGTSLEFLPSGSWQQNAADHLTSDSVADIFKTLSGRYDVIVLDTAPLLAVPDAAILAPVAKGNVLLVARAGVTRVAELEECARRMKHVGVDVKGVVLNGIDPQAGRFRYGVRYASYRYLPAGAADTNPNASVVSPEEEEQ
jgi:tyrosine-protein kinase Etk/Wzc